MGLRFRNSIRLAKGVRLNLGKKSASLSVGVPGATLNVGKKGTKATVGLPGTGVSYTTDVGKNSRGGRRSNSPKPTVFETVFSYIFTACVFYGLYYWLFK